MRACATCSHPNRNQIDDALRQNTESLRALAKRFGLVPASLGRHRNAHLKLAGATGVPLNQLESQLASVQRLQEKAEKEGRVQEALACAREARALSSLIQRGKPEAVADSGDPHRVFSMSIEEAKARIAELEPPVVAYLAANPRQLALMAQQQSADNFARLRSNVVKYLEERLELARQA